MSIYTWSLLWIFVTIFNWLVIFCWHIDLFLSQIQHCYICLIYYGLDIVLSRDFNSSYINIRQTEFRFTWCNMRVLNHDLPPINSVYDCACALYFLSCVTSEAPSILCMRHRVASSYYVTSFSITDPTLLYMFDILWTRHRVIKRF
jgi:hypothetical protein